MANYIKRQDFTYTILTLPEAKTLPDFIMSSLLLSKTDVRLKHFFAHNVRYGNFVTFRIGVTLESLQYLDDIQPQCFDCCIEYKSADRTCH